MRSRRKSIKHFENLKADGFKTQRHTSNHQHLYKNIIDSINQRDEHGHRGIKIITMGETTDEYDAAVASVLKQKNWQIAYLSDIDVDPDQALGLILNKDVFIDTLDPKKLLEEGYEVIRVTPPVVIPDADNSQIVTSPKIRPVLIFAAVLALVIIAAWAAWKISR